MLGEGNSQLYLYAALLFLVAISGYGFLIYFKMLSRSKSEAFVIAQEPGCIVLDVRSEGEWNDGHVDNKKHTVYHIPISNLQETLKKGDVLPQDRNTPILTHWVSRRESSPRYASIYVTTVEEKSF